MVSKLELLSIIKMTRKSLSSLMTANVSTSQAQSSKTITDYHNPKSVEFLLARVEAMEREIKRLELKNELLVAKLAVATNDSNVVNYYIDTMS